MITFDELATPFGPIAYAMIGDTLVSLAFGAADDDYVLALTRRGVSSVRRQAHEGFLRRLGDYLAGDLHALDALAVDAPGTEFQRTVWAALRTIPVGQTWSYGQLAAHIGRPKAVRAVGLANGRNPIAVVVPCHRVIGADGSLTGFGGGLPTKRWLLKHEGVDVRD